MFSFVPHVYSIELDSIALCIQLGGSGCGAGSGGGSGSSGAGSGGGAGSSGGGEVDALAAFKSNCSQQW